ncbi:hypothetical protein EXS65_00865 [Candidatus Peribacteria bacterium]|nr:hypothetical protein [Candidatus Peribacteria bacterium]
MKKLFLRSIPAVFLAGTVFGVGISQLGAAFKGSTVFRDVPVGHFADDAIGEMHQLGIIKGLSSEKFGPNEPVTRAQIAVLFKRLRDEMKGTTPAVSSSVSSSVQSSSSSSSSSVASSSSSSSNATSSSLPYSAGGYVHFDANGYNVYKNVATGQITIIVARTGGNQGAGSVDYSFSGGTAVAGKNYQPLSGTLSFGTKETSKKITMVIMNDSSTTGTKTVNLVLKNAKGAVGISNPANVILNINDPNAPLPTASSSSSSAGAATTISLSSNAYGVAENGGSMTVTVVRSGITTTAVGVNYTTTNASATPGADYTTTSGTFAFAAGETTKTFTVSITNNSSIEGNRSFSVNLSSPTGGSALGIGAANVTINDDEGVPIGSGSLKFSTNAYAVTMSQGVATITVNHVLGVRAVTVNYATNGGSGASGVDYTPVSGTLTFAANEISKTFTVSILTNGNSTGGKTVNLILTSPSGGTTLADPSSATITINL